jgi:hypothetical protein
MLRCPRMASHPETRDLARTWSGIAEELGVTITTARGWALRDPSLASLIQVDARRTPHASRKALAAYRKEREKLRPLAPSVVAIPVAKGRAADSKAPAAAGLREGGR